MWESLRHDSQGSQANGGDGTDTDTLEYKAGHGMLSNHTCQATGKYERRENLLKEAGVASSGHVVWVQVQVADLKGGTLGKELEVGYRRSAGRPAGPVDWSMGPRLGQVMGREGKEKTRLEREGG